MHMELSFGGRRKLACIGSVTDTYRVDWKKVRINDLKDL